jgi:cytochrome c oxidase subunit 1
MYVVIAVASIFFGKRITVPGAVRIGVREGMAPPHAPAPALPTGHANVGLAGFIAPGTFALAMVFLVSFMLYYFVNWKYLSTVWPLK